MSDVSRMDVRKQAFYVGRNFNVLSTYMYDDSGTMDKRTNDTSGTHCTYSAMPKVHIYRHRHFSFLLNPILTPL
jgi:hypothetical protein